MVKRKYEQPTMQSIIAFEEAELDDGGLTCFNEKSTAGGVDEIAEGSEVRAVLVRGLDRTHCDQACIRVCTIDEIIGFSEAYVFYPAIAAVSL